MKAEQKGMTGQAIRLLGAYPIFQGVQISIADGDAGDYLLMRSSQLAALLELMAMEDFEHMTGSTKNATRWLASSLSSEINHIIPLAIKEAETNS